MNWWIVGAVWLVVALFWAYASWRAYRLWTNVRDSSFCAWCAHGEHPWNWRALVGMDLYHDWLAGRRT